MPIPTPRKGEKMDDFHSRCMGNQTMLTDFPDQSQRNAVCFRQWDEAHPDNPHPKPRRAEDHLPSVIGPDDPACFHSYMGLWAIEPLTLHAALRKVQDGTMPMRALGGPLRRDESSLFSRTEDGTAIVRIIGQMTKGISKFGGTSSVLTRMALRQAVADESIKNILLAIDSPGGMVAGTPELADAVARADTQKPVIAYIEDLGASAAYWVASQARAIYANPTAHIGSIGVMAILEDTSRAADRNGIQVHVISTGAMKGAGVAGTPILPEHLAMAGEMVAETATHFFEAVQRGRRKMRKADLEYMADGRVVMAAKAKDVNLIDGIQSFDETLAGLARMRPRPAAARAAYQERRAQVVRIPMERGA